MEKNIPVIGITSIGISLAWMVNVNGAMSGWRIRLAMIVGASCGAMISVPLHNMMIK